MPLAQFLLDCPKSIHPREATVEVRDDDARLAFVLTL